MAMNFLSTGQCRFDKQCESSPREIMKLSSMLRAAFCLDVEIASSFERALCETFPNSKRIIFFWPKNPICWIH